MGVEPLLTPSPRRFVLFPVQYHGIWAIYKKFEGSFTTAEELVLPVHLSPAWSALLAPILEYVCAWNSEGERINRMNSTIQIPEARCALGFVGAQLDIFREGFTHALLLATPEPTPVEDEKEQWLQDLFNRGRFPLRLALLGVTHSIFQVTKGLLVQRGTTGRSELSGLEDFVAKRLVFDRRVVELVHVLTQELVTKLTQDEGQALVEHAVLLEMKFAERMGEDLTQHIHFVADDLLVKLGLEVIYHAKNPGMIAFEPPSKKQIMRPVARDDNRTLSFDEEF